MHERSPQAFQMYMEHSDIFQEGILNDLKNGVNPKSKKMFFHITKDGSTYTNDFFKTFTPRTPSWLDTAKDEFAEQDGLRENATTARVCVSPSIEGALNSLRYYLRNPDNMAEVRRFFNGKKYYVYTPLLPIEKYNIKSNADIVRDNDVWDAKYTGETWILDKVTLRLYGVIIIDKVVDINLPGVKSHIQEKVKDKQRDPNKNYKKIKEDRTGRMEFSWHWDMTPKEVVQDPRLKSIIDKCIQKQIENKEYDPQLWPNIERTNEIQRVKDAKEKRKKVNEAHEKLAKLNHEYINYFNSKEKKDPKKMKSLQDQIYQAKKEYMELNNYEKDEMEEELNILKDGFKQNMDSITKESYVSNLFGKKIGRFYQEADDMLDPVPEGPVKSEIADDADTDTDLDQLNQDIDALDNEVDASDADTDDASDSDSNISDTIEPPSMDDNASSTNDDPFHNNEDYSMPIPNYMKRDMEQTPSSDLNISISTYPPNMDESQFDIGSMGMNDSNQQNQYDQNEVKMLNQLITDEQRMIMEYFDAVKNTNVDVLRRLYGDIGADKAVHQEELMFAKAELTGEPYEPANPDIKNEYQNLLNMGMDESTAMYTAIDKHSVWGGNDALQTMDDSDFTQLEYDISLLNQISLQNQIIFQLGNLCMSNTKERDHAMQIFSEYYIMEAVANTKDIADKEVRLPGPLKLIKMAIDSIVNLLKAVREKSTEILKRLKTKNDKTALFIKNNGIAGLFKNGVYLYFYDEKQGYIDLSNPVRYIDLMLYIVSKIMESLGIPQTDMHELNFITEEVKNPIRPKTLDEGIKTLKGIIIEKSKVVVDKHNEALLEKEIFGYSDTKLNGKMGIRSEDGKYLRTSDNVFNRIEFLSKQAEGSMEIIKTWYDEIIKLAGVNNSIYYTNRVVYNKSIEAFKYVVDQLQKFCNYLAHDLGELLKLNKGLLESVQSIDTEEVKSKEKLNIDDSIKTSGSMINKQKALQQESQNTKRKKRLFGK